MKTEVVQAFIGAVRDVLQQEMGSPIEVGKPKLQGGPYHTDDVTALIGLAQDVEGTVIISMPAATGLQYIAHVMGEEQNELDELAQSGIGELANVIAGRAGALLGEKDHAVVIAPPTMILGRGSTLSTLALPRLVVAVETPLGPVALQLAVKDRG